MGSSWYVVAFQHPGGHEYDIGRNMVLQDDDNKYPSTEMRELLEQLATSKMRNPTSEYLIVRLQVLDSPLLPSPPITAKKCEDG